MSVEVDPVVVQVTSKVRLEHRIVKCVQMMERAIPDGEIMSLLPPDPARCRIVMYARGGKVRLADERNSDILNTGFRLDDSAGTPYFEIHHTGEIWAQAESAAARLSIMIESYQPE